MEIRNCTIAIALAFSQVLAAQAPNTWTKKGPKLQAPPHRYGGVGFAVGNKGYIGGGQNGSTGSGLLQDFWEYDIVKNVWTQRTDLPGGPRIDMVSFAIGAKGYMATGFCTATNSRMKDHWEYDPAGNSWTRKADLPGPERTDATGLAIGNKGYVLLGSNNANALLSDVWEYDPTTNTWTGKAPFGGGGRADAAAFASGTVGYVGCGGALNFTPVFKDFWLFDPTGNTWTKLADFAGGAGGKGKFAFAFDTKGYFGGGDGELGDGHTGREIWEYDTRQNRWTQKANLPGNNTSRNDASTFVIGGKAFVCEGQLDIHQNTAAKDVLAFDPFANTWTPIRDVGNLGGPRHSATGFSIGSKAYVGTGWDGYAFMKDFWEYDVITQTLTQKADFGGTARCQAVGFSIGAKGYIGTGDDGIGLKEDLWEYDPATNKWTAKAKVPGGLRYRAVGFGIGSKGYIGTGQDPAGAKKQDFYAYDQATNTWTAKAAFGGGTRRDAAAFSINGLGYVATGFGTANVNDLWMYDPAANTWTRKADLPGAARHVAAAFTASQHGYISGGSNGNTGISDVWEYDVLTNAWVKKAEFETSSRWSPVGLGVGTKGYVISGLNSTAYLDDIWEYSSAPQGCDANAIAIALTTDPKGHEIRWDIVRAGEIDPILDGRNFASSTVINISHCLLNGSYSLRFFDSGNDGIPTGGYVLRTGTGKRILDNAGNGAGFTSLSQAAVPFSLPLGATELVPTSCDKEQLTTSSVIQAVIDPLVTLGGNTAQKGYEFQIFDPNGGFNAKIYQSVATPGTGFPANVTAEQRPAYLKLSAVPGLPLNKLLNVRVRRNVNAVYNEFGPACRMKVVN